MSSIRNALASQKRSSILRKLSTSKNGSNGHTHTEPTLDNLSRQSSQHTPLEINPIRGALIHGTNGLEDRIRKLSKVVEQTPATVVVTDIHGTIEYVNPAFEQVTGYSYEEAIGANPRILKSGLMPEELYQEMWATISAGEVWRGELCNRRKNGELYWDFGTVSPIHNDQGLITNYIAVKEDITDRKQKDQELDQYRQHLETLVEARTAALLQEIGEHKQTVEILRENERRLAEAQRIGKLGSWEWDIENNQMFWSDETYRIFALNSAEINLTYQYALEFVHPDDRQLVERALQAAANEGKYLNVDHKVLTADGQQRVVNLKATPVTNDNNNITRVIGTVQDITDRVRIESQLREKDRLTHELALGREIQLSLLPEHPPSVDGWQFAAYYESANEVGGDFYDFIHLPDGHIGLVVADVSGKGVAAALLMSLSRAVMRTTALSGAGAADTLARSNKTLYNGFSDRAFVTAFYANIDTQSGTMEYSNAGHNLALHFSSSSKDTKALHSEGIVLGMFPKVSIAQKLLNFNYGDVLVCYTDGLSEAQDRKNEFYRASMLHEVIKANAENDAADILEAIVKSWKDFVGDFPQVDDTTIIVIKRSMPVVKPVE